VSFRCPFPLMSGQRSLFASASRNERAPLVNRNHRYLDYLVSASTVPLLRSPVDPLSVLERVAAFRIVHVDHLPRRQDKDLGKVLVFREPLVCPLVALVRNTDNAGIENLTFAYSVAKRRGDLLRSKFAMDQCA
jgi:hypothetical protein